MPAYEEMVALGKTYEQARGLDVKVATALGYTCITEYHAGTNYSWYTARRPGDTTAKQYMLPHFSTEWMDTGKLLTQYAIEWHYSKLHQCFEAIKWSEKAGDRTTSALGATLLEAICNLVVLLSERGFLHEATYV